MLKEPKQVPKEPKVATFQKYTQCFAYGVSWFNMDAPEESTALPSINSFLLRACLDLNTSLLQISSFDRLPKSLCTTCFYKPEGTQEPHLALTPGSGTKLFQPTDKK